MISLRLKACMGTVWTHKKPGSSLSDRMSDVVNSKLPYQVKLIVLASMIYDVYPSEVEVPEFPKPLDEESWMLNATAVVIFPRPSYELCHRMAEIINRAFNDYRRVEAESCPVLAPTREASGNLSETPSEGTTLPDLKLQEATNASG